MSPDTPCVDHTPAPRGASPVATVNGVPLHTAQSIPDTDTLRQRACTELLRQAAQEAGLLSNDDQANTDGVCTEAASDAIEALLDSALQIPEASDAACRRHHAAHARRYRSGEKVRARHILFAVTPGVDVQALRNRAEACLLDLRCHVGAQDDCFASAARELSNCPSAALGGELGWLSAADCAAEFAKELLGHPGVGVLPHLVHSRFGLHVVEVLQREAGLAQDYAAVRGAVAMELRQQSYVSALRQYLLLLAGSATVQGVDLESTDTPLVQ